MSLLRHLTPLLLLLALVAATPTPTLAQESQDDRPVCLLTDSAFASVLTCGPGNDFYTTFGHSALRICDSALGIDVVYNYGTFDFDQPHFYLTFARGDLDYRLSRDTYSDFLFDFAYDGRAVWEQRLRLTPQECRNLFAALETNYLPEYRYYRYDFFRDNCASRVRDMVGTAGMVHRTLWVPGPATDRTYRQMLHQATTPNLLWWQLGIDIVLGMRCDHHCNNMELMFLPAELMTQLDTTRIAGTGEPLAFPARQLLRESKDPIPESFSPTLCFWLIFLFTLALTLLGWFAYHRNPVAQGGWKAFDIACTVYDILLFVIATLAGLLILFLWLLTNHYSTKTNLNILWASPIFIYFIFHPRHPGQWITVLQMALLAIVLVGFWWLPQSFNDAIIPIALIYFIRLADKLVRR